MKKSEHVFLLIKSLSKSEKRSFKLFASQYGGNGKNNYTLLFDVLDRMKSYNHDLLTEKVKDTIHPSTLPTVKVQLKQLILQSLRNTRASKDIGFELRRMQDYIQILYEKGLYDQCHVILKKAIRLAKEHEQFLFLDQLSIFEYHLVIKEANIEGLNNFINSTFPSVEEARKLNEIQAEFEQLAAKMRLLQLKSSSEGGYVSREKLDEIISHPIMKLPIEEYPIVCQVDFHTIWGHYSYISSKVTETYEHYKKALSLIEQIDLTERHWLTHARYLLISLSTFKEFELFDQELDRIKKRIEASPAKNRSLSLQKELDRTLYNIRFHRDLDEGNFRKIETYKKKLITIFDSSSGSIDGNLYMAFQFNMAYAALGASRYKEALMHINSILNNTSFRSRRIDLQSHSRLMNICIHYELGNHDLISSLTKSTRRYLNAQHMLSPLIDSFLKFASSNLTASYTEEKKASFQAAIKIWKSLLNNKENSISLEYIDFISWLEAHITGNPMEYIIRRNC